MRLGVTPVPIPNTMVKTQAADGTALETVWESRWLPNSKKKNGGLQLSRLERTPDKREVGGSSPLKPTFKQKPKTYGGIAQLGERLPCKQEVTSSNLVISTRGETNVNTSEHHVCTLKTAYKYDDKKYQDIRGNCYNN